MPKGGKREGAGRKPGTPNRKNAETAAAVAASGLTPLDYMLGVMRDKLADNDRRDRMAVAVAPYVHPKLASTELTGAGGAPLQVTIAKEDAGLL